MRAKPSYDDELLEPLPVVVDGVAIAPVWASERQLVTDVAPHMFEAVDALCARIVTTPGLAALGSWLGPQSSVPQARAPLPPTTFSRIFELHPAHLGSLSDWWRHHARNERVVIARRLTLRAPRCDGDGVWRMRATLRDPWRVRPIRMELSLWRHLGTWTKLDLEPNRRLYIKGFYFGAGHHCLDVLCDRLARELLRLPADPANS